MEPSCEKKSIDVVAVLPLLRAHARIHNDDLVLADYIVAAALEEAIETSWRFSCQAEVEEWLINRIVAISRIKKAIREWMRKGDDL